MKLRRESDYSDGVRQAVARTVAMAATLALASVDERHDVLFAVLARKLAAFGQLHHTANGPSDRGRNFCYTVNKARNE